MTMRKLRNMTNLAGKTNAALLFSSQSATPLSLSVGPECQIMTCLQLVANAESD